MVSVIIPAYNAERTIGRCLDSLLKQNHKEEYEVIVVDDGSTDSTPDIVLKYNGVRLVRQKNAGPAAARNRGASEALGETILFTDSDCVPVNDWISEMLRPFKDNSEVVGVKGRYKTEQKEIIARFVQLEYEDKYDYMMKDDFIDFIDTYSAGFRREVFIEMKGYDMSFPVACAEDVELSYRMSNRGYKMVFNPGAVVYHTHPDGLLSYLRKKYKFAFWRMVALKKNPNKAIRDSHTPMTMKFQLLFPPAIFLSALLGGINSNFLHVTSVLAVLFLLSTLPFALKGCKRHVLTGILSPILLFFRAAAQSWGMLRGIIYALGKS